MPVPTSGPRLRRRPDGPAGDAGFTLVEVLVSLTIFVTFATAATMAVANSVSAQSNTRNRVGAANIAQSDLEQARTQPTPASTSYSTSAPGGSGSYQVNRVVTVPTASGTACPMGSVIQVKVTVSWPGNNSVNAATVVTC